MVIFQIFNSWMAQEGRTLELHWHATFGRNRWNCCRDDHFCKMAAICHHFLSACSDHQRRAFVSLYCCAKSCWNRCSSIDMHIFRFCECLENAYWGFGNLNPWMGGHINKIQRRHILALVRVVSAVMRERWCVWSVGEFPKKGINKKCINHSPRNPRGGMCTKFGMPVGVADVITCDKFFGDWWRGVNSVGGRKLLFPIDKASCR